MNFRTKIDIKKSDIEINHHTQIMMMGSCFSQNIGNRLIENKFKVDFGPFGILYNPISISSATMRLISQNRFNSGDLLYHNGVYQSLMHHGSFSSIDPELCINTINETFDKSSSLMTKTDIFLFTFGTAYAFRLKENNQIVANCHKLPPSKFIRERLSIDEIVDEWTTLINALKEINSNAKYIFTVSPIRHWKDGAHENVISKSILHLAIDKLQTIFPSQVLYFPAYEIVMDELRDYRFYDKDMMHPSTLTVDYIWNRFGETYFSPQTIEVNRQWIDLQKALNHRPLNELSKNHIVFLERTLNKIINFQEKYPHINCEVEISTLKDTLKK